MKETLKQLNEMSSVATIGGSNFYQTGIGNFNIKIKYDNDKISEFILKNILYFPNSPVNISSDVCLADHFLDDHGAYVQTSQKNSILKWDGEKFSKTLQHSINRLPEILVNEGTSNGAETKIRNLPGTSCHYANGTELPEDLLDSTDSIINKNSLICVLATSDSTPSAGILRTQYDEP